MKLDAIDVRILATLQRMALQGGRASKETVIDGHNFEDTFSAASGIQIAN